MIDRDLFNEEATKLRARFDANRGASPAAAARLLEEGEDELYKNLHPDIYKIPNMPGGSKFMRNPPLPSRSFVSLTRLSSRPISLILVSLTFYFL